MPARSNNGPSSRLVAAASELLEAAGVETATSQQMQISSDIVAFKESMDTKLNTLHQTTEFKLSSINETVDSKLNTLTQRIINAEKGIASLEKCFSDYAKDQKITFALQNSNSKSFTYYEFAKGSYRYGDTKSCAELVQHILFWFRRGEGCYIPNATLEHTHNGVEAYFKASNEKFKVKLLDQIHFLTGTKPRIELGSCKKDYAIFYS